MPRFHWAVAGLRIALAGPLRVSARALFAGATWVLGGPAFASATLSWLGTVNRVIGVFNPLPGSPLDGSGCCTGSWGGEAATGSVPR